MLWLAVLLPGQLTHTPIDAEPAPTPQSVLVFVDPERGQDTNDGDSVTSALRTLESAKQRLQQILSAHPQSDIVIDLLPGRHRVPTGGKLCVCVCLSLSLSLSL